MITLEEFTRELEKEFDDITPNTLTPNKNYREIPNFSSMYALIIIAFVDSKCDILLNGQDLKSTQTVKDLYDLIQYKLKK